jgi:clan AA aspartic protease
MGLAYARLRLANARRPELAAIEVEALADTGTMLLCIPEHVAMQLQLDELEKREVTVADGSRRIVPYMGPLQLSLANRGCFAGAMVMGDQVLLGAVPMEDMDVVVHPRTRQVIPNPDYPNIAGAIAMGMRRR